VPTLYILQGPDKGHNFDIDHTPVLIGRGSPDLPLTDNTVSRRHAQLIKINGVWTIQDMNSANGTYVNGVKFTTPMDLKQGDQIRCGATLIVFGGQKTSGVPGELGASLRLDENGNIVESSIMASVPSMEDSVVIAAPETSNAVDNLRLLYELSTAISSVFDQQQLLETVMDMIFDNLPADRGFILLKENNGAKTNPCVVRYRSPKHTGEITISRTIVNYVMDKQEGVICTNAMRDPRFAKGKSVHNYGIRSALCVPITARGKTIGVIHVDTTVATHTYAGEQLRLLTAIGLHTGMAIEHARLFHAGVQAERLAAAGETVAYLSHGIKNILQGLQSASDTVEMGLNKNKIDTARKGWSILQRNLTKIQNLVLNMLAFTKPRIPNLAMTQLNQIINETHEMVAGQADDKHVGLITDLDENLPSLPLDPDGMQQIALNLILNALDVVEPDHGVITIKTAYDDQTHEAIMTIADNGPGIPPDKIDKIFHAFVSSKGQGGTGLGLAVVKKIIQEHHGDISVTSDPNEGTTFTIKLPTITPEEIDSGGTIGPTPQ